jgi:hypothetical protein
MNAPQAVQNTLIVGVHQRVNEHWQANGAHNESDFDCYWEVHEFPQLIAYRGVDRRPFAWLVAYSLAQ